MKLDEMSYVTLVKKVNELFVFFHFTIVWQILLMLPWKLVIAFAPARVSVQQIYTSGALHTMTDANVG